MQFLLSRIKKNKILFSTILLLCCCIHAALVALDSTTLQSEDYSPYSLPAQTIVSKSNIYIDATVKNLIIEKTELSTAFQLFSHGRSGHLYIDGQWRNPEQIANWLQENKILQDKTHLNIYGCNFAKGEKGRAAVEYLKTALGVSVAASDDITGIDGDWELEVGNPHSEFKISEYKYNLQTTYYVSPTGNDANDGLSMATAWQTLDKLNNTNFGGGNNTILLEGGQTFTGNIEMNWEDWGSAANPNILSSYGTGKATIHTTDNTKDGVYIWNTGGWEVNNLIVRGTDTPNRIGIHIGNWENGNSKMLHLVVENCEIYHFNSGITIGAWSTDGSASGFQDVTIRNNEVHDTYTGGIIAYGYFDQNSTAYAHQNFHIHNNHVWNIAGDPNKTTSHTGSGIVIGQVDGAIMEHNLVHDGGWNNSTCGGPVGLWTWDSNDITIQYNEVHHWQNGRSNGNLGGCDGGGFDLDGGVSNSIIQYNYSHDNEGPGYLFGNFDGSRTFENNVMRYNISENDAKNVGAGIVTFNAPGETFNGLDIYNNTVYMGSTNSSPAFLVGAWGGNMNDIKVHNNIFYTDHNADMILVNSGSDVSLQNNLYYSTSGTYNYNFEGTTYTALTDFQNMAGQEILSGTNVGIEGQDPLLSNIGNGGTVGIVGGVQNLNAYRLDPNSPAINSGLDLAALFGAVDFFESTEEDYHHLALQMPIKPLPSTNLLSLWWANLGETLLQFKEEVYSLFTMNFEVGETDFFGKNNHLESSPDIGADESLSAAAAPPPPTNLLINGGFETGDLTGWSTFGGGDTTITVVNTAGLPFSGTFVAQMDNNAGGFPGISQTVTGLCPNTDYVLEGYLNQGTDGFTLLSVRNYGGSIINALNYSFQEYKLTRIEFTTGAANTSASIVVFEDGNGFSLFDDLTLYRAPYNGDIVINKNLPTCSGSTAQDNGSISVSSVDGADRYDISSGTVYSGQPYSTATNITATPFTAQTNIPNTGGYYTLRFYFGGNDCYDDRVVYFPSIDCADADNCSCTEYIYLNDPQLQQVHKFAIDADGELTEIGSPWFDNNFGDLSAPHGLGIDLNGFLYIGESVSGDVRRLTCDGSLLPESDFVINRGSYNFDSENGYLYIIASPDPVNGISEIQQYSTCDGSLVGTVTLTGGPTDPNDPGGYPDAWGFQIQDDGTFLANSGWGDYDGTQEPGVIWSFNPTDADFQANTSYAPVISQDTDFPATTQNPQGELWGVTGDGTHIYTLYADYGNNRSCLYKFTNAGVFVEELCQGEDIDYGGGASDDGGFHNGQGIVYNSYSGLIYISGGPNADCVAAVDPVTMAYIGTSAGNVSGQNPKGIGQIIECCPTAGTQTFDTLLCNASINDTIFLQSYINCNSPICEGQWTPGGGNTGLTYNDCNNSITITSLTACGSFTLSSDGMGTNVQCPAFSITVNINVAAQPEAAVFAIQPSCVDGMPQSDGYFQISSATNAARYNISSGGTYTGDTNWANAIDISGASYPYQFNTGLSNADAGTYTIRIFSDQTTCGENCYTDYTITMNQQDCTTGCDCEENIYLNELGIGNGSPDGNVHKFEILDNMGNLSEIGSPWLSDFVDPHGLGIDLNGNLYIAATNYVNSPIAKISCDGEIIDPNIYNFNGFAVNMASDNRGNLIMFGTENYVNGEDKLEVFNPCTGAPVTSGYAYTGADAWLGWGAYTEPDGTYWTTQFTWDTITATAGYVITTGSIYDFGTTIADHSTLFPAATPSPILAGTDYGPKGIFADASYVYIVFNSAYLNPYGGGGNVFVVKYDKADGSIVAESAVDNDNSDGGWWGSRGIVADQNGIVYVGGNDGLTCIQSFMDDGSGNLVPGPTYDYASIDDIGDGKTVAIATECCPTNNNVTIDTTLCAAALNDTLFLQQIINCDGPICEGLWQAGMSNTGLTYNACNNSITIDALNACGTFTLESDGTGNNPQCGAFVITVNINVAAQPEAAVFAIQPSCVDGVPQSDGYFQISSATNAARYNISSGGTYTGDINWANAIDISGASYPYQFNTGLSNADAGTYTIRIFSDTTTCGENCYTDYTITMNQQDCTTGCDCQDYMYLNDPQDQTNGFVHKMRINADSTLTEIGSPWFPSGGGLPNPHGLGQDLNGFLYIGRAPGGTIRRLDCDGNIFPTTDFVINDGGFNFQSIGNTLYVPSRSDNRINAYSLCDGSLQGYVQLSGLQNTTSTPNASTDWGFHIAEDSTFYVSAGWNDYDWDEGEAIYRFKPTEADFTANTTYNPILDETSFPTGISQYIDVWGITSDAAGNFYVLIADYQTMNYDSPWVNWILKYDSNGVLVAQGNETITYDNLGYELAQGIVYYEPLDLLFLAAGAQGDCVAMVDPTTLNYIGTAAAHVPGQNPKGLAIARECCPTNNNVTIDTTLCAAAVNDTLFLQELINCDGTICEGLWQAGMSNTGLTYNACNNSITIDALNACGTFTLESDGTGNNPQCGAFVITVNINVAAQPEAAVFAIQPSCVDGMPQSDGYFQISSATNAARYNISSGGTYTGDTNWANAIDISGASYPYQFNTGLSNADAGTYTIRIFSDQTTCGENCYTDYTITMNQQDCTTGCDCEDYMYLNDPQDGSNGFVHKMRINIDSTLTEIGNPWFPSGGGLPRPHGLAQDHNGFLYIGETPGGAVRRLDCDGNIFPTTDFVINDGGFNFQSIGNTLYVPSASNNRINAYSLCDGSLQGYIHLSGLSDVVWSPPNEVLVDWGFHIAEDSTFYVSAGWNDADYDEGSAVYRFKPTESDFIANTTYSPILDETSFPVGISQYISVWGITSDAAGNFYIVIQDYNNSSASGPYVNWILKYDSNGVLVAQGNETATYDNLGYEFTRGLVYYEPLDLLFLAAGRFGDCVAMVDPTTLNYIGTAAAHVPGQNPKGLALARECCPTNKNVTVDTTLCAAAVNDTIFLQELINCDGTICEGLWQAGMSNTGLTYNSCNNSITIDALNACGTFTLESDGTGNNPQCGAFVITVNISINVVNASIIAADQTICSGGDPAAFTVSTAATGGTLSYQWQRSTMDCNSGFSNISGATSAIYDPPAGLTETTYYRVIVNSDNTGCSSGMCADTSNCLTITVVGNCDWGDLPDTSAMVNTLDYQTLASNNGPIHYIISGLSLGSSVDGESDGQPSSDALGDGSDEDGIPVYSSLNLYPDMTFRLPFSYVNTTGNTAHVEAWMDWNANGEFDVGEMVVDWDDSGGSFPDRLEITIPATVPTNSLIGLRIRISNQDNMTPYGLQPNGEVEDYLLGIGCPQVCVPIQTTVIRN